MLEFCAPCMEQVRKQQGLEAYDLKTLTATLESLGFEAFIMGPRYLPLTHGSWNEDFVTFSSSTDSQRCNTATYPKFMQLFPEAFPEGKCVDTAEKPDAFTADIFAMRASHPKATEMKVALGACQESHDFDAQDPAYDWTGPM